MTVQVNGLILLAPLLVCPLVSRLLSGDRSFQQAYDNEPAPFQPPSYVFGPVWAALYLLLGYATDRAYAASDQLAVRQMWALLILNALWTPLFVRRYLGAALAWIAVMVIQAGYVAFTTPYIRPYIVPYLAWISFAMLLNGYYATRAVASSSTITESASVSVP
jgi:translocator protein